MDQVCIPVPMPSDDEPLEMEVTVGGTTLLMEYRIETLRWSPEMPPDERTAQLRAFLAEYDSDWSLVQIGAPGDGVVPITFRRRRATAAADESDG